MRKLLLAVFIGALVAFAGTPTLALGANKAKALCAITKLNSTNSGAVTAQGKCLVGKKSVPASWSYSYMASDADGYTCGVKPTTGSTSSFRIQPEGADKVTVRVSLKARSGTSNTAKRNLSVSLGGDTAVCGTLKNAMSDSASLCPWTSPWSGMMAFPFEQCGKSTEVAAWASPMKLSGHTVSLGHPVTAGGSCYLTSEAAHGYPAPMSSPWLGFSNKGQNMLCDDGLFAWVNAFYVGVENAAGQHCYDGVPGRTWSFQIPSDWGGKLYVEGNIGLFTWTLPHKQLGLISQTGVFNLNGSVDPCTVLRGRSS